LRKLDGFIGQSSRAFDSSLVTYHPSLC
jgi:hypothetical protein